MNHTLCSLFLVGAPQPVGRGRPLPATTIFEYACACFCARAPATQLLSRKFTLIELSQPAPHHTCSLSSLGKVPRVGRHGRVPPGTPLSKGKDLAVRSGLQEPALKGFGFRASRGRVAALLPGVARLLSREATGTSDTMRPSVASGHYWGCPRDAMYALYFSA